MIGNGASALQVCPDIQHQVKSLTIFQRSPHWIAPHEQFRKPIPESLRFLLREVPLYRIEKSPKLARKQGAYAVVTPTGLILKRGHDLAQVLRVLEPLRPQLVE